MVEPSGSLLLLVYPQKKSIHRLPPSFHSTKDRVHPQINAATQDRVGRKQREMSSMKKDDCIYLISKRAQINYQHFKPILSHGSKESYLEKFFVKEKNKFL